ncbi:hypothetical protein [Bradyrhizobium tunisiense]|uniref:hypothetical protein n=1 Tax=Bradyrhizobium tunisiense TaxID=3278709 RepID=UPI0035DCBAD7
MNLAVDKFAEISPDMVRRTCGGWLAIAPKQAGVTIGVTAPSSEQAQEKFRLVLGRWVEILKEAAN